METTRKLIEFSVIGIEILAVTIMVGLILIATVRWLALGVRGIRRTYHAYRTGVGQAILIGLELLVAADIVRTVVLDMSLTNIAALGALVLVRTFLGWTLTVEIEERWPWQAPRRSDRTDGRDDDPRTPGESCSLIGGAGTEKA
jgi:uncharacterized membrane protein